MAIVRCRVSRRRRMKTPAEEVGMKSPATEVADIDDLLIEILQRLPTKTLLLFKLVSKQWLSIISSSDFSISHTRFLLNEGSLKPSVLFLDVIYRQPPTKFVFLPLNRDTKQLPLLDLINAPYITIMQSCNGLLLCTYDYDNQSYFICNPVIKKFKTISCPMPPMLEYHLVGVNLAFDPLKSPYYKIISIWQEMLLDKDEENNCLCRMTSNFSMDIYSSEADSWNASKIKFTSEWAIQFDHAIFFNGAIHWDSVAKESLYLDVETECLMPMPMPMPKPSSINLKPPYCDYDIFCLVVRSDEDKGDSMVAVLQCGTTLYYNFKDKAMEVRTDGPKANGYRYDIARFRGCEYFETLSCDYQVVTRSSLVNYVLSPTIIDLGFLAVAFAALSSQNPGVITIANAAFGSDPSINPDLLAKAF
ncbi:PREDICTED: F-box protein At5g07610-like [Theobroma cacao]|uniref:F-box protein At5g07610-like n=1 Tax=Theobroma cacao TaxID=3641 RepID=A0AB32WXE1_THECC|nr:PREDICTED: F-box protein At5g07610-like [Theobroma cacao]